MLLKILLASLRPAQRQLHRSSRPFSRRWILGAFIKGHHYVRSETDLNLHRLFRAKKMSRPVEMRTKRYAFFRDFAQIGQAENLKPARIGKNRPIPTHEPVQTAHLSDGLDSGPQIKVVGIAEQNLDTQLFEHILRNALDRTKRPDRHEYRRLDFSMRSDELASARRAASRFNLKLNRHRGILADCRDQKRLQGASLWPAYRLIMNV